MHVNNEVRKRLTISGVNEEWNPLCIRECFNLRINFEMLINFLFMQACIEEISAKSTVHGSIVVPQGVIREHGSVSLCRDGQKTKWRLQCKY